MAHAWYVAAYKRQDYALYHLQRQGFDTWIPTEVEDTFQHGRTIRRRMPLFGRYLLVGFDIEADPWQRVNNTIGIRRLLPLNELNPRSVPQTLVDALMEREARGVLTPEEFIDLARGYAPGDWIDVKRGAYSGQAGHFLRADYRKGLVIVLLKLLNRPLSVSIPPSCVDRKPMISVSSQERGRRAN